MAGELKLLAVTAFTSSIGANSGVVNKGRMSMPSSARRRFSSGLAVVVVLCTGVACGENTEGTPTSATTSTSTSTSTEATTTSAPPVTAASSTTTTPTTTVATTTVVTTSSPAPTMKNTCPSEGSVPPFERAARCLYDAWQRDDRQGAANFGEPAAVAALFEMSKREWEFQGCSEGYDDSYLGWGCAYAARSTTGDFEVGIGFTFVAYDDEIVVKLIDIAGE